MTTPESNPQETHPAVATATNPTLAEAADRLTAGLDRDDLVTVVGRCTVEYDGRASSSLGPGDRLVVCKPDGTVMVHTDKGHKPVNWQPPGCEHTVSFTDEHLQLMSVRTTPAEELVVVFQSVVQVSAFDVTDKQSLDLSGTEADLKNRILANPNLDEPGFTPLSTERGTAVGAVDIYGEDRDGRSVVIELKRRRVGPDAVGQLERYVDALRRDLPVDTDVRGILVAPSVTDRARRMLAERGLEFSAVDPPGTD